MMMVEVLGDDRPRRRKRKPQPTQKTRCRAHTQAGNPCRAWAILGGAVCNKHGGSAPQVMAKARERMALSADWVVRALLEIIKSGESEGARVAAANSILDRALGRAKQSVEISTAWDETFEQATKVEWGEDAESEIVTLRAEVARLRKLTAGHAQPELPAGRPPARVDDRPSGPLEGRVLDPDEEWPPRR